MDWRENIERENIGLRSENEELKIKIEALMNENKELKLRIGPKAKLQIDADRSSSDLII